MKNDTKRFSVKKIKSVIRGKKTTIMFGVYDKYWETDKYCRCPHLNDFDFNLFYRLDDDYFYEKYRMVFVDEKDAKKFAEKLNNLVTFDNNFEFEIDFGIKSKNGRKIYDITEDITVNDIDQIVIRRIELSTNTSI